MQSQLIAIYFMLVPPTAPALLIDSVVGVVEELQQQRQQQVQRIWGIAFRLISLLTELII